MDFLLWITAVIVLADPCASHDIREPPDIQHATTVPDYYIRQGDTVWLPCSATGNPQPTCNWLHNGKPVQLDGKNVRKIHGALEIKNFQISNQGYYQCEAYNVYGKAQSQIFHLRAAILDDSWDQNDRTYNATVGECLKVEKGHFNSLPESSLTWKTVSSRDDPNPQTLLRDNRIVQDLEGNLWFTYVMPEDELPDGRFYKSEVYNAPLQSMLGGSSSRIVVHVTNSDSTQTHLPPVLVFPDSANSIVDVLEGYEMRIQCIFRGRPTITVSWSGPAVSEATTDEAGTMLVLSKMKKSAAGQYVCTGKNGDGTGRGQIMVRMNTIPKFSKGGKPKKQTLTEGETAVFPCQTTNDIYPPAVIKLKINGEVIQDGFLRQRTKVSGMKNGMKLMVTGLKRDEDIMVVQCEVSNKHKTHIINAPLNVLKQTRITEKPQNQSLYSSTTNITFLCPASSDPSTPVTVQWLKDGQNVSDDLRLRENQNTGTLTLNLDGLVKEEKVVYSGKYTCIATNGYSNDSHTAILEYKGKSLSSGAIFWIVMCVLMFIFFIALFIFIYLRGNQCISKQPAKLP